MKKFFFIFAALFVLVGAAVWLSPTRPADIVGQRQAILLSLYEKKYPLGDGKSAPTASDLRSAAISEYIKSCCADTDQALELLRNNKFHIVNVIDDPKEMAIKSEQWDVEDKGFDKFIYAIRGPSIRRFWRINATYELVLFIRDGRVEYAWGRIDATMP
ncbi:hypothetical protein [Micavibrio aeruginosavorus]|uniref:Uncharacterized protein n=1 Tax=Micavibrio aeruginosavorus (strain ARL-13) TaxID=856793 RepID=G2KMR1_MICAA|nr:hypothetical protein [Micavibrio aeruginosavorus]AEP08448.1 hypothetical protein MICA_101 [Micavibrio aeruginosavorus ARL-13]